MLNAESGCSLRTTERAAEMAAMIQLVGTLRCEVRQLAGELDTLPLTQRESEYFVRTLQRIEKRAIDIAASLLSDT